MQAVPGWPVLLRTRLPAKRYAAQPASNRRQSPTARGECDRRCAVGVDGRRACVQIAAQVESEARGKDRSGSSRTR